MAVPSTKTQTGRDLGRLNLCRQRGTLEEADEGRDVERTVAEEVAVKRGQCVPLRVSGYLWQPQESTSIGQLTGDGVNYQECAGAGR